jgi:hypothetical protein
MAFGGRQLIEAVWARTGWRSAAVGSAAVGSAAAGSAADTGDHDAMPGMPGMAGSHQDAAPVSRPVA